MSRIFDSVNHTWWWLTKINTHFCTCACLYANVCMYVYTYIWVYIFRIFMSQKTRCAYYFEKCGSVTAVSWNCNTSHPSKVVSLLWPLQTEDGCHQSMWNTMFQPLRSYCAMTRFRAYQTLTYIIWALCFTQIYPFFGIPKNVLTSFRVIVP